MLIKQNCEVSSALYPITKLEDLQVIRISKFTYDFQMQSYGFGLDLMLAKFIAITE